MCYSPLLLTPSNSIVYRVSPPRPPRILNAEMFSSPPKPFDLPSYAGGLAHVFAKAPSPVPVPVPVRTRRYNSRVLDFVDVEARQSDESDGSSSHSV